MKSRLLLMSCFVFNILIMGCDSEQKDNDLKRFNIKGNVKSIKTISYDVLEMFGEIAIKTMTTGSDTYFNEEGNRAGYITLQGRLGDEQEELTDTGKVIVGYDSDGGRYWKFQSLPTVYYSTDGDYNKLTAL